MLFPMVYVHVYRTLVLVKYGYNLRDPLLND